MSAPENLWECSCSHCKTWRATLRATSAIPPLLARGFTVDQIVSRYADDLPEVLVLITRIGEANAVEFDADAIENMAQELVKEFRRKKPDTAPEGA